MGARKRSETLMSWTSPVVVLICRTRASEIARSVSVGAYVGFPFPSCPIHARYAIVISKSVKMDFARATAPRTSSARLIDEPQAKAEAEAFPAHTTRG